MEDRNQIKKENRIFWIALVSYILVLFAKFMPPRVNEINATMLAFSYKYGFVSRGFIGTIYQGLGKIFPMNVFTYSSVKIYTMVITVIYILILLGFYRVILHQAQGKARHAIQVLTLFFTTFAVPFFVGYDNFGRLDIYLVMLTLVGVMLLTRERLEWLLIPLAALAVMVHQGYVFMYLNIFLVLLLYKILSSTDKRKRKYIVILICCFVISSVLFLWFEFFSHMQGKEIYQDVIGIAKSITYQGKYHKDVIDKEIMGVDLSVREWQEHLQNFVELPIFLLLFSPYLILLVGFFERLITSTQEKLCRWKYIVVAAGALTMLPNFILKVDYGRWIFAVISYYIITLLVLIALGDHQVMDSLLWQYQWLKKKGRFLPGLLMAYALCFTPLCDLSICSLTYGIYTLPQKVMEFIG